MIKKTLVIFGAYLIVCLAIIIALGKTGDATTALYNMSLRLLNNGFVANEIASATTASYNYTAQVVDQNGTVLSPGTASTTAASANMTIRIIDANGFVVSGFPTATVCATATPTPTPTASPSPSPSPSPAFVDKIGFAATPAANPTPALPVAVQAGDCAVMVTANGSNSGTSPNLALVSGWGELLAPATWTTNGFSYGVEKIITPSEITAAKLALQGVNQNMPVCIAFFRHVTCSNDQKGEAHATSTAPRPPSITTTLNGDLIVSIGIVNGSTGLTYTTPSGYTNAVYQAPITGTAWGCYIDYITTAQSSAGATQPAAGTISASNDWYAEQLALPNLGGTQ